MHPRLPREILDHARSLRLEQTDAENLLWLLLRGRRVGGFKFRRQHPVGHYILDFYCEEAGLAIELDGGEHNQDAGLSKDRHRSSALAKMGIEVIRFWNDEVLTATEAVLERIFLTATARAASLTPAPLPEGEGIGGRDNR